MSGTIVDMVNRQGECLKTSCPLSHGAETLVGAEGFEPPTLSL